MIFNKYEKVLLVAPSNFSVQLLVSDKLIKHITSVDRVFPAIYEMAPNIIIFDYDYLSDDLEKILRRIRSNSFYNKIKIYCLKNTADTKTDELLKTLGVNHVIFKNELQKQKKGGLNQVKLIFDSAFNDLLVNASA